MKKIDIFIRNSTDHTSIGGNRMEEKSLRKMGLKPYLEAVGEHCRSLSKEELVKTILDLAQEVPLGARVDFLEKIRSAAPASTSRKKKPGKRIEEITLERIEALKEEIEERITSIEEGTYWDEYEAWEEYEYDEEPDYVTERQREELGNLLLEAEGFFLDGELQTAHRLYGALFELVDLHEEIAYGFPGERSDLREARARYCRCVYEVTDPVRSIEPFVKCMKVDTALNAFHFDLSSEPLPLFQDVIDARAEPLGNLEAFLPVWEKRLKSQTSDRAAILRLEAVERMEGIEGVSRLVREWKAKRQHGYLFWIQRLAERKDWQGMLGACREALEALPKDFLRERAAEYLVEAARELGDSGALLTGKREAFLSVPTEENLIGLLQEAEKQNRRLTELDAVLAFRGEFKKHEAASESLGLKMLLMAGKLLEAFEAGKKEKSYGWSYGKAGILYAAVLSVLVGDLTKAPVIRALVDEYAEPSYARYGEEEKIRGAVSCEILTGLASVKLTPAERRKLLAWADRIGRERVHHIVSEQYRNAYDRAARALCGLAETYALSKEKDQAASLLKEFLYTTFPRHRAFRAEVKRVIGDSAPLQELRIL